MFLYLQICTLPFSQKIDTFLDDFIGILYIIFKQHKDQYYKNSSREEKNLVLTISFYKGDIHFILNNARCIGETRIKTNPIYEIDEHIAF